MKIESKSGLVKVGAVCLAYILLRFWGLTSSCLWFDEIFSIHAAEHPWNEIAGFVAQDLIHPPLFYVLLKFWIMIGGESLFWLRFFSVFFSIIALIPFYLVCRELKLKSSAVLIALSFFAANGALIKYAQEVGMYGLFLCLSLFSMWLFSRFFYRGKNIWILTIINVLLVYTHYFGWFVVITEVLAILIFQRIKIRHALYMLGIVCVSFVPWMWAVWKAASEGADVTQNIGWITPPGAADIFDFAFDTIEPFYYQQSNTDPGSHLYITIPILVVIGFAKLLFYLHWTQIREKSGFYLLSLFSVVPVILAFVLSWLLPVSIWGSRHLIIVFVPILILAAVFISDVLPNIMRYVLIGVLGVFFAIAFVDRMRASQPEYIWCAWEKLAPTIKGSGPQKVYVFEDLVAYHFWFATHGSDGLQVIKVNGIPELAEDKAYFLPRGFDGVQKINGDEIIGDHFWIAFRDTKWDEKSLPLSFFSGIGYKIGRPQMIEAQGMKAFLVEVKK